MLMTSFSRPGLCALVVAAGLLAAAPARAAIELEPGQWQDTETGTENGQPTKPEVTSDCMTPEEAKDPVKALSGMKDAGGECSKFDIKESGNTVTVTMLCGDPRQMQIDMAASYTFLDRKNYTGTMKSTVTVGGTKTTADKKVVSKWIGACTDKK